jgi:hypothetical protein
MHRDIPDHVRDELTTRAAWKLMQNSQIAFGAPL